VSETLAPADQGRRRRLILLILLVCVVAAGVFVARRLLQTPASTAAAPAEHVFQPTDAQMRTLGITAVAEANFQSEVATEGSIAYDDEAVTPVYSPYSGRVLQVQAHLGDHVRLGQTLFTVAAGEYAQAVSDVVSTRATLETARAVERRQRELYDAGAASEHDWQQAHADRVVAEASWTNARARLHILGYTAADIDAMERAPTSNADAPVYAPIAGTITQRAVSPGQNILSGANGGGSPVFMIADVRTMWAIAYVREADAVAVKAGQTATVTVPSLPGRQFTGTVQSVASGLDLNTHRLPVRITLRNPDGVLKPEMYAEVRIATSDRVSKPAVPVSALVYDGDMTRVFVESGGKIVGHNVTVGRRSGQNVEVVSGLHVGERIVTSATLFVDHAVVGE
jgi:membrane fusion protein, heavy metal efflux system